MGFSLVEVLCAILILGVGLVGLTSAIATALRSTRESELHTAAALFAAGLIETLRAEEYLVEDTAEGECGSGLEGCRWEQTVSAASMEGLFEVSVTIHGESGARLYELKTLLFEPPLSLSDDSATERERRREARRR
jgi:type IV pilus modification protein PilV